MYTECITPERADVLSTVKEGLMLCWNVYKKANDIPLHLPNQIAWFHSKLQFLDISKSINLFPWTANWCDHNALGIQNKFSLPRKYPSIYK